MWACHCVSRPKLTTASCALVLPLSWAWEETQILTVQGTCVGAGALVLCKTQGERGKIDGGREWDSEQVSRTRLSCFQCSNHWLQAENLEGKNIILIFPKDVVCCFWKMENVTSFGSLKCKSKFFHKNGTTPNTETIWIKNKGFEPCA